MNASSMLKGKRVLITGCCGTVGSELTSQLLTRYEPKEVLGIDNNESATFFLEQEWGSHAQAHFVIGDMKNVKRLRMLMEDVDVVFHAAAFKHVELCERSPTEAVENNILGVQNIIEAATANRVGMVVFTSSDKAVNPTNVMGTSKLMGERLMTAAHSNRRKGDTVFASTRFGNVLGSRGSVIPIFREQIKAGGPVTLTHQDMTRFIMSIGQAARLVLDSAALARGGEVFITKMPVIRIQDLAEVMIRELAPRFGHDPGRIAVKQIGVKPGEKMYEELMSLEETRRALELTNYFAVLPAFRNLYRKIDYRYDGTVSDSVDNPYNSCNEAPMSQEDLTRFLRENNLLEDPAENAPGAERHTA
jgi:FlaA1/EpsC-like NDP-sugar epimerase